MQSGETAPRARKPGAEPMRRCLLALWILASLMGSGSAQVPTYTAQEIVYEGHRFFGAVAQGLGSVVEQAFSRYGQPDGYILGEEATGAMIGGLRYGEGTLFTKNAG